MNGVNEKSSRRIARIFVAATLLASLVAALVLSALGTALVDAAGAWPVRVILAIAVAAVLIQALGGRPLQSRWQVPESWRRQIDVEILSAAYGFILGLGVFTAVVVAAFWVFVAATLIAAPTVAVTGWMVYGSIRSFGFLVGVHRGWRSYFSVPRRIIVAAGSALAIPLAGALIIQ